MKSYYFTSTVICFALLILIVPPLQAQSVKFDNEKQEVYDAIVQLFDAMRASDSTKAHQVFRDDVRMLSSFTDKDGNDVVREGNLTSFLTSIGTPKEVIIDEQIWNVKIEIDDNLAQLWCDYALYVGDKFNHCGVDAFQLVREQGNWKIINITDTRRNTNCLVD